MDAVLFYGGIALAGTALLAGILCIVLLKISFIRLNVYLDEEYGKKSGDADTPRGQ